ncbi:MULTISPECIES: hypothetical protein [unclassified Micromonospora]|uniref:hypothetical protein n=1 Tax=unclassified Micromonospora TaxID=2617518 RepID=UPI000FB90A0C|nr:hypothetical protein [Micromonospora sp. Llam0]ROO61798.1 hypothetical protein EDC02_3755 [Micromonospora sp. Llam0]
MAFDIRVKLGDTIRLQPRDRYRPADGPVVMRLTGVRLITNRPESDEWIWLEGVKLNRDGTWGDHALVMARAALLAPGPR